MHEDQSGLGDREARGVQAAVLGYFCKTCGVHCVARGHLAEMGGDYVSINLNTLDGIDPAKIKLVHWDGRHDNWEAGPRLTPWEI